MATYRTIAASEVDADSPATATLAAALAANPVAITEGATGAPRIQVGAFSGSVAGDVLLWASESASINTDEAVTVPQSHYRAVAFGVVRFKAVVASQLGSARASFVRVRLGGSPVALNSVSATTTIDVTVLTGDVIYLSLTGGSGASPEITAHAEAYTSALRINGGG
jgi:hypothetical protein